MALENKLPKGQGFVSVALLMTGALVIGGALEYLANTIYSLAEKERKEVRQTLNNTNYSLIYTNQ